MTNVYPDKPFHVSRARRKELDEIALLFSTMTGEDSVRMVFLTGMPGAGKTELARQFGKEFESATPSNETAKNLVITLIANSEESLFRSVKEALRKLRLPFGIELINMDLVKILAEFFRKHTGAWLLIIDGMLENHHEVNSLLPRPGSKNWGCGQVLITTQDNNLVPACHELAKKKSLNAGMTREDALALLKEISGVEIDDFAEEIIKELQFLPLALVSCAIFVGEMRQDRDSTQFGWEDYLNLFRKDAKLESRSFFNNNTIYPWLMKNACTIAVNRMAETSDVLRLAFSFLSYCVLFPVPLNVLAYYVKKNLPVQGDTQLAKAKGNEISRCSLLIHERSLNVETIKCHQVIHLVLQSVENAKPIEQQEIEFVKMMKSLNETLDFMDNTDKEVILLKVLVRPHLKSFVDHAVKMSWNNTAEFVLISMKNGQFLFSTSNMPDVDDSVESLEFLYKLAFDLDLTEERRCDILANLGFYYLELDREEDALNFLCKAYSMTQGKGEKEWLLLRCRISYNLAQSYYAMGSPDLARDMMRRSIHLAKKVYVNEEDKIMNRYRWLARFYLSWYDFWSIGKVVDEASEFFNNCPPDSVDINRAFCLNDLAYIYADDSLRFWTNSRIQSERCFDKSFEIFEKVLGEDVPSYPVYGILAFSIALRKINEGNEARKHLEKALKYSIINDDKLIKSFLLAFWKHISGYSWICNLLRGRLLYVFEINLLDHVLADYYSGRISPSRRIMNGFETTRRSLVRKNYFILLLLVFFFFLQLLPIYILQL